VGLWAIEPVAGDGSGERSELEITRGGGGRLAASFGPPGARKPLQQFYRWGASLRFEAPTETGSRVSVGQLDHGVIEGRTRLPGVAAARWTARHVEP
jgi:hypothetical protein